MLHKLDMRYFEMNQKKYYSKVNKLQFLSDWHRSPLTARLGLPYFVALRVILGIFEGPTFPSLHTMTARWVSNILKGFPFGLLPQDLPYSDGTPCDTQVGGAQQSVVLHCPDVLRFGVWRHHHLPTLRTDYRQIRLGGGILRHRGHHHAMVSHFCRPRLRHTRQTPLHQVLTWGFFSR